MIEYVCTSENAKIAKGCIESHKLWILGVIKLFLCHKKAVLFMERKEWRKKKRLEKKSNHLNQSKIEYNTHSLKYKWSVCFVNMLYLNYKKENSYLCKRSQAQTSVVLIYTSEGDLYLVSKSLGH